MKQSKLVALATLVLETAFFIACSNEGITNENNLDSEILNKSLVEDMSIENENFLGGINFDDLNHINSDEITALVWEEFIPSDLNEFNYLNEFSFGDVKHTIVLYNNTLYEFYNEELASEIPVTVENNKIVISSPEGEIVFLTITDEGKLENQVGLYFDTVSLGTTKTFASRGPLRQICMSACIATHRLLGVPKFLDSICCFWLSDKWDGVPWL